MGSPFEGMKLEHWPDFVLAISGILLIASFGAMVAGANLPGGTLGWVSLMAAIFCFGVAGKIAFQRVFNRATKKWHDGWRNNLLSNIFILVFIALGYFSYHVFKNS